MYVERDALVELSKLRWLVCMPESLKSELCRLEMELCKEFANDTFGCLFQLLL